MEKYKTINQNKVEMEIGYIKEDAKQLTDLEIAIKLEEIKRKEPKQVWEQIIETCGGKEEFMKSAGLLPKQETLEEAEKEFEKLLNGKGLPTKQLLEVAEHYFIVGYEIAKERSYSEEDMKDAYIQGTLGLEYNKSFNESFYRWFEHYKK